jgi:hypothetical protein
MRPDVAMSCTGGGLGGFGRDVSIHKPVGEASQNRRPLGPDYDRIGVEHRKLPAWGQAGSPRTPESDELTVYPH